MIMTKQECRRIIQEEQSRRKALMAGSFALQAMTREHDIAILRYQKYLRLDEYYSNTATGLRKLMKLYYRRRKNVLGEKLGITIGKNVFGEGLLIWHYGSIVVNGMAQVGKNCILHGNNCIGNDGKTPGAPKIGDNVDIGTGAVVLGDIRIADNVTIGAGAVVVHSVLEEGATVVGVPARVVKRPL